MTSDGHGIPLGLQVYLDKARFRWRDRLVRRVIVSDGDQEVVFICETIKEYKRAHLSRLKEAGTIKWLRKELRPGDVLVDVGANVGVFSLLAGHLVGPNGTVYAFEPHLPTAVSLMRNVDANRLTHTVRVLSCALGAVDFVDEFNYRSWAAGSAMSQLGDRSDSFERDFEPVFSELKLTASLDALVSREAVRPPDLIKIDVDGNELQVLQGMENLLRGPTSPRAVQVEVNERDGKGISGFLADCGFSLAERHYSSGAARLQSQDPAAMPLAFNAIFRPAGDLHT
jgi:FkbM family methyltransferase